MCNSPNSFSYRGSELEIFAEASNWKAYYKKFIQEYLGNDVLEVGAGIGATAAALCNGEGSWVCLEPDATLSRQIENLIDEGQLPGSCKTLTGTIHDIAREDRFDTILYIDVLEHIEDDLNEVKLASEHLKPDGFLVILTPAHQGLYTPFDEKIGHYRRYNKRSLSALIPKNLKQRKLIYLDSVGGIASLSNRYLLRSDMPTQKQIQFWDKQMIPISRALDPLFGYRVGKSMIGVWQR